MENICFTPIEVSRGRKFKGKGYLVGSGGVSCNWAYSIVNAKIWDPASKSIVFANQDFVEDDSSIPPEQIEADKQAYINFVIDDTARYCRSKSSDPNSPATEKWIRNSLLKKLPKEIVDKAFPDNINVAEEVEKTIRWASTLTTRPMMMYGRACKGGKPYSRTRKAEIAYKHLRSKGITHKPEFDACWAMWTNVFNLPDVRHKFEEDLV